MKGSVVTNRHVEVILHEVQRLSPEPDPLPHGSPFSRGTISGGAYALVICVQIELIRMRSEIDGIALVL